YRVSGRNANGSGYSGAVSIVPRGGRFDFQWQVASSSYRGTGTLQGNLMTVDWGDATPVVYAVAADGTLSGLWSAGAGEETLTPER
ncbi:MAG: fibronectin-binding protein, partial [Proteobacteria bacterium]|nr:fibronectin-binding protein [Pseudomonadota bacterium]